MISAEPEFRPQLEDVSRAFETLEFKGVQPIRRSHKEVSKAIAIPTASRKSAPLLTTPSPSRAVSKPLVTVTRLTSPAHQPTPLAEVFRRARYPQERPNAVNLPLLRHAPALNRLSPDPIPAVTRGAAKDTLPTVVAAAPTVPPGVAAPTPVLALSKPSVQAQPAPFDFQTAAQPSGHLPTHLRGSHRTTIDSISKIGSGRIDKKSLPKQRIRHKGMVKGIENYLFAPVTPRTAKILAFIKSIPENISAAVDEAIEEGLNYQNSLRIQVPGAFHR